MIHHQPRCIIQTSLHIFALMKKKMNNDEKGSSHKAYSNTHLTYYTTTFDFEIKTILTLKNNSLFHNETFNTQTSTYDKVCFNTSMTNYQEILTDPSYKNQIVTITY